MEKTKILIIDDEVGFTHLVKLNLELKQKYEVRTEDKGANGFAVAKEFQPDLILLDILMPDLSGSVVLQQLKADPATKDIPVVYVTALVKKEGLTQPGGTIDGQPFLAKPVGIRKLTETIEQYARKK